MRNIWYGIQNIIAGFPIIWKDRDWDSWYIYKILGFKLRRMEKLFRKYGHAMESEAIADQIKEVSDALGRLIEDDYCSEMHNAICERWGELEFVDSDKKGYSTIKAAKVNTEEDEIEYTADIRACMKAEEEAINNDLSLVFDTMRDNIRSWWD